MPPWPFPEGVQEASRSPRNINSKFRCLLRARGTNPHVRPGRHLRHGLPRPGPRHGYPRGAVRAALALATGLHRASDWFHSAGVPGPCDRVPGKLASSHPRFLLGLLSPIANPSLIGEGLARAARNSAAGNGIRRGLATGRRTAPPLRTTGRLRPIVLNIVADDEHRADPPRPRR